MDWGNFALSIITAVVGLWLGMASFRKFSAETDSLQDKIIRDLRADRDGLSEKYDELMRGVRILVHQLEDMGVAPRWSPDDEN